MIIAIVGSRKRDTPNDKEKLAEQLMILSSLAPVTKIITGDCETGGDKIAREIAIAIGAELDVKSKKIMDHIFGDFIPRWAFTKMCYERNDRIAKEQFDYFIALPLNGKLQGGTGHTVSLLKKYHDDWERKLIII